MPRSMKPPVSYYGGKQLMVSEILPLIPQHIIYTESFFGGGAILFAKPPSQIEVINDLNDEVINFYCVLQQDFEALQKRIKTTLHSRKLHKQAYSIYQNAEFFDSVTRAWAFWVLCNEGFACKIGPSWGYDKSSNSVAKKVMSAKQRFDLSLKERIELLQIECGDALKVITSRDRPEAFHYCDPPYFNSNCGHYSGYTESDFEKLLKVLSNVKGKFLLSSYPSDVLERYTNEFGWHTKSITKKIAVTAKTNKSKTEVLTANYLI